MLNTTVEILEFEPIGAQVPNRGSYSGVPKPVGQPDIDIYGLRYLQRVADGKNHQPLHVEPGFWLYMPTSTVWPVLGPSVVRQAVIPHGNSLLALGEVKIPFESTGKPNILETSSIPTRDGDPNFSDPTYLDPFKKEGKYVPELQNPNKLLEKAIEQQNIIKTVTLHVSAENPDPGKSENEQDPECKKGRIGNIPFLVRNANVTEFKSTFWIETVRNPGGTTFLQLQYTQRAILNFRNIDWPHISVATLIKQ